MNKHQDFSDLHDRFSRGEELSTEEQVRLERWYAAQDNEEAALLNGSPSDAELSALQTQVNRALQELARLSDQVLRTSEQNEVLRAEVRALRSRLSETAPLEFA